MSLHKRLRILRAVFSQQWHSFICPGCKTELFICGQAPDMRGLLCENCEGREFDKWLVEFRNQEEKEGAA